MHNASVLFATVSWQQTILWGSWSASDSRGIISLSAKRNSLTNWASSNICCLKLVILMVKVKFVPYHKTR